MARRTKKSSAAPDPGDEQRQRVLALFAALRLPLTPEQLDDVLSAADREGLAPLDFVERLLGPLVRERRDRAIEYRIRKARFPERLSIVTVIEAPLWFPGHSR